MDFEEKTQRKKARAKERKKERESKKEEQEREATLFTTTCEMPISKAQWKQPVAQLMFAFHLDIFCMLNLLNLSYQWRSNRHEHVTKHISLIEIDCLIFDFHEGNLVAGLRILPFGGVKKQQNSIQAWSIVQG